MIQDSARALGRTAETNLDATKQQPSSYEKKSDDLNAETTTYADAEDTYPQQTSGIPSNASYWDLLMTVYMPLIALWFGNPRAQNHTEAKRLFSLKCFDQFCRESQSRANASYYLFQCGSLAHEPLIGQSVQNHKVRHLEAI